VEARAFILKGYPGFSIGATTLAQKAREERVARPIATEVSMLRAPAVAVATAAGAVAVAVARPAGGSATVQGGQFIFVSSCRAVMVVHDVFD